MIWAQFLIFQNSGCGSSSQTQHGILYHSLSFGSTTASRAQWMALSPMLPNIYAKDSCLKMTSLKPTIKIISCYTGAQFSEIIDAILVSYTHLRVLKKPKISVRKKLEWNPNNYITCLWKGKWHTKNTNKSFIFRNHPMMTWRFNLSVLWLS